MKNFANIVTVLAMGWCATTFALESCPEFLAGVSTGFPANAALTEISGIAASRKNPGVLWVHNDSGDGPRVYALRADGTHLGTYDLQGASAVDYEDIAIGPGPVLGVDYLYIGDIGDNLRVRSSVVVYRVPEPSVSLTQSPVTVTLTGVDALPMQYPTQAFDCETLMVDSRTADIYLVTKDVNSSGDNGTSFVFHYPAPHNVGSLQTLTQVASVNLGTGLLNRITGGDISPLSGNILLRSYVALRAWPRACDETIAEAMAKTPCVLPLQGEIQGEAVAFTGDGQGYYTTSEHFGGAPQPFYFYDAVNTREVVCPTLITSSIPQGQIEEGSTLVLQAPAPGSVYQFRKDGAALADDPPRITGASTGMVTFNPVLLSDSGVYTATYDDGTRAPIETASFNLFVLPAGSLPLSSFAWIGVFLVVAGVVVLKRRRVSETEK